MIHCGGNGNRKPWGQAESQKICRNHPDKGVERKFQAEEIAYPKAKRQNKPGSFWELLGGSKGLGQTR